MKQPKLRAIALALSTVMLAGCQSPEEKVQGFVNSALVQLEQGNVEAAHIEFSNALQINPKHVQGLYEVTAVFEQQQEWRKVKQYLDRVLELEPNHQGALQKSARLDVAARQIQSATGKSERLARFYPDDVETLSIAALVAERQGNELLAKQKAQEALALNPDHVESNLILATLDLKAGDIEAALQRAQSVSDQEDTAVQLFQLNALVKTKDINRIAPYIESLIVQRPKDSQLYLGLAGQYAQFDQVAAGRDVMRRLFETAEDPKAHEDAYLSYVAQYEGAEAALVALDELRAKAPDRLDLDVLKATALLALESQGKGDRGETTKLLDAVIQAAGDSPEAQQARMIQARLARVEGATDLQDQLVTDALAVDSEYPPALQMQAERWMAQGELDRGLNQLRTLYANAPDSASLALSMARGHRIAGRTDLAMDLYEQAFLKARSKSSLTDEYGGLLLSQNRLDDAERVFSQSLQSGDLPSVIQLAQIKLAKQDWVGAFEIAEGLKQLSEGQLPAMRIEGMARLGVGQLDLAKTVLTQFYEASEQSDAGLSLLISAYSADGQLDRAIELIDSHVQTTGRKEARLLKARLLLANQQVAAAEGVYKTHLQQLPSAASAYLDLSRLYQRQNQIQAALAVLNEGIAATQQAPELLLQSAVLRQTEAGDIPGAIESYEALLTVQPENEVAANNLAMILVADGPNQDLGRAMELVESFKQSDNPNFLDTLGWVYLHTDKLTQAIYFLEEAVRLAPENPEIRYHLGRAYVQANQPSAARAELTLASANDVAGPWVDNARKLLAEL